METTLHRQLKSLYCDENTCHEVVVGGYRIDAVAGERLIEIQCSPLSAIRDKIRALTRKHEVLVVKPLAARKYLIVKNGADAEPSRRRASPRRETLFHLFHELVHFMGAFPHRRLTLEVLLIEQEEHRIRIPARSWKRKDYEVEDRSLVKIAERRTLRTVADLIDLLPMTLGEKFTTQDIAREAEIPRWLAQKTAYCLRACSAITVAGKQGNSLIYERNARKAAA